MVWAPRCGRRIRAAPKRLRAVSEPERYGSTRTSTWRRIFHSAAPSIRASVPSSPRKVSPNSPNCRSSTKHACNRRQRSRRRRRRDRQYWTGRRKKEQSRVMFDSQCDLAALVYEQDQDPDQILRGFASDLKAGGYRAVGLVQLGHHCLDAPELSAMLVHSGEELQLFHDLGTCPTGGRLDGRQLLASGAPVAPATQEGAD